MTLIFFWNSSYTYFRTVNIVLHVIESLFIFQLFSLMFLILFIIYFYVFSSSWTLYLNSKHLWRLFSEFSSQIYFSVLEFPFFKFYSYVEFSPFCTFMASFFFKSLNIYDGYFKVLVYSLHCLSYLSYSFCWPFLFVCLFLGYIFQIVWTTSNFYYVFYIVETLVFITLLY